MDHFRVRQSEPALLLSAAMRRLGVDELVFSAKELEVLLERNVTVGTVMTEDGSAAVLLAPHPKP